MPAVCARDVVPSIRLVTLENDCKRCVISFLYHTSNQPMYRYGRRNWLFRSYFHVLCFLLSRLCMNSLGSEIMLYYYIVIIIAIIIAVIIIIINIIYYALWKHIRAIRLIYNPVRVLCNVYRV